jgi:tripartite-type tricarboxylate transporter receptor subunit TctC
MGDKQRRRNIMWGVSLRLASAGVALCLSVGAAFAAYPERPIRFIIPFPPGGSTDVIARAMQPKLEKLLGQPVIIENRAGAGGSTGLDAVAKSAPDGYTIGMAAAGALVINPHLQQMPFDPIKDLTPVTRVAESPFILAATPSFAANSLREVVALAKNSPGFSIGHGGNGTAMHLTAEMFNHAAGISIGLVPYRGTAPVVTDLIGGHLALGIVDPPPSLAAFEAGQIKGIAVSWERRFAPLPKIPTFAEQGLTGVVSTGWFGIVAPAGCAADIVAKLNAAFVDALRDPEAVARVRATGMEPTPMTASEFAGYIRAESQKWADVVARAGLARK